MNDQDQVIAELINTAVGGLIAKWNAEHQLEVLADKELDLHDFIEGLASGDACIDQSIVDQYKELIK